MNTLDLSTLTRSELETRFIEAETLLETLQAQALADKHKVAVYDLISGDRDTETPVLANRLEISPFELEQFMVEQGIKLKYHDLPADGYSDWFKLIAGCDGDVEYSQCLVSPLGMIEITKIWNHHRIQSEIYG